MFHPCSIAEKHALFQRLHSEFTSVAPGTTPGSLFTRLNNGQPELLATRPALLISSTSWTPDEDFSLLYDAMVAYSQR